MKIDTSHPDFERIVHVTVDGRKVLRPIAFDMKEGWVIAVVPDIKETDRPEDMYLQKFTLEDLKETDWKQIKLEGKIKVLMTKEKTDE